MPDIRTHEPDEHDNAYSGLLVNDAHWAFGTDFEDPLAGVDTTVPDGVDPAILATYCLMLGDDALVLSQRLAEWCSSAPDLEEDIALANIALDLLGQARLLLARAAAADGAQVPALPDGSPVPDEDRLAYFRDVAQFRNVRLAEVPNGDFAQTVARILLFSTWRLALFEELSHSRDAVLAAVGAKAVKELTYHRDFAGRWFLTLAQGTDESRRRLVAGLDTLWPYWTELFETHDVERAVSQAGVGVDPAGLAADVDAVLDQVLAASAVARPTAAPLAGVQERRTAGRTRSTEYAESDPQSDPPVATRGRDGAHTEALGSLLAEMQVVARAHPRGQW